MGIKLSPCDDVVEKIKRNSPHKSLNVVSGAEIDLQ